MHMQQTSRTYQCSKCHSKNMRYLIPHSLRTWLYTLAVLGMVCVVGWYVLAHRPPTPPSFVFAQSDSFDMQRAHWESRVRAVGGVEAYEEFSRFALQNATGVQHQLAHAFGEGLYTVEGEHGVSVCDSQFSYGCFHVMLGKAIHTHGLAEINKLDALCRGSLLKSPEACEHGIGHGVVAYLGYAEDALVRSLGVCDTLRSPTSTLACYSGAFMEYNTHTMLGSSATSRQVIAGNLVAPCDTLAPKYRSTCAFWQPQWWMHGVYQTEIPDESLYHKIGALCDRVGSADATRFCYEGLGNITPQAAGYSPAISAMLCRASTTSKLHQLYCVSSAANVIGIDRGHADGRLTCTGLMGIGYSYCVDYAESRAGMFTPKSAPALRDL